MPPLPHSSVLEGLDVLDAEEEMQPKQSFDASDFASKILQVASDSIVSICYNQGSHWTC